MQLLQGQILQQRARLAVHAGLSRQLLNALRERRALVGLGRLKHFLKQPHALGPRGVLHTHRSGQQISVCMLERHQTLALNHSSVPLWALCILPIVVVNNSVMSLSLLSSFTFLP